ncbi:MAG: ABC transporter substrate-binding protein [Actinomycetia bacterium]|nr:ABC transporter substrate-binding protein [Actinomycetes bacterium]
MKRQSWGIALAVAAGGLIVGTTQVTTTGASSPGATVTLTVGLQQDLDTPNVTAGYLVASYELWNLQYATLTDKAANDFATIPGLAESWTASNDGLTYTYTLRDGLKWSDDQPLTAEDVAWTINTSRDQVWLNHSAVTANLTAVALDDRTVEITSAVPDPKLPTMDVYILPKHIWEEPAAGDVTTYEALDGVGSGPFTLKEWKPGQEWTMEANPNYWQGVAAIDQVVFRLYTDGGAMAAALENGEIDAAHNLPAELFVEMSKHVPSPDLRDGEQGIVTVAGEQGGFTELAMNGMAGGLGDGHPALLDIDVRHAVALAINRDELFERVALGIGTQRDTLGVSPNTEWNPEIPADQQLNYDPAKANELLDNGGYLDTDGDGVREMPDGSRSLTFRYAERSESTQAEGIRELVTGWLAEVGIATEVSVYDDTQLTDIIASGEYDMFVWGWTPFVDPDTLLSYFKCDQVTTDVANPLYNDANWCSPEYDALYAEQNQELDHARRVEIVHEMLTLFHNESTYVVLYHDAETQAYRTDRFEGWLRQPADIGPVLFSNSSPTYYNLKPLAGGTGDDSGDSSTAMTILLIAGGVAVLAAAGFVVIRSRSRRDERD